MPAAVWIRLRPPSHPTRWSSRSDLPSDYLVGPLDVDAGVVLREPGHLAAGVNRHPQLVDPVGQDALDVVLPQPEPVVVADGEVADVQRDPGEARNLSHLPPREEAIGDSTLIEHLDRACVQTTGARADELLAGAPLDNGDVDPRLRQLARQHQPRRTARGDLHRMLGHRHAPVGIMPVATGASHPSAAATTTSNGAARRTTGSTSPRDPLVDNTTRMSLLPSPSDLA